jgi:hypothetical protein
VDEDGYPHPPLELTADTDERFVVHSDGAVSKLAHMAVLNASGVRAPAYFTPLISSVGDAVALYFFASSSSALRSPSPSDPDAQVSLSASLIPSVAVTFSRHDASWVAFCHTG